MTITAPDRVETTIAPAGAKAKARRLPGEEGVWLFICGDMMVFAVFFLTFIYYRGLNPAIYDASQLKLNEFWGLINTLFLLTSSWCVAAAVHAARHGKEGLPTKFLVGAMVFGGAFVCVKIIEYGEKFAAGINVLTNEFFMFYFMFTGIHLVHVLIGLGVLTFLLNKSRKGYRSETDIQIIEGGGAFWHLVDLLWVVLFALLYLTR
ncbi:MAG: cytochrome c oxidase subunit 3 [Caulobacterales bacterium]